MNKYSLVVISIFCFALLSCGKDNSGQNNVQEKYMTLTAGSSWVYETTNNNAPVSTSTNTMTSTNRDSVIFSNQYHVFTNSFNNSSDYFAINGVEYYNYVLLPIGVNPSRRINFYFAADQPVNTSWNQIFVVDLYPPSPVTPTYNLKVTCTIKETGLTRIVNSKTYNKVVYVETVMTIPGFLPTGVTFSGNIKSYYAPNYGLIEETTIINSNVPMVPPPAVVTNINTTKILKSASLL